MKLLVYEWNGFGYPDLKETLRRMGHRVERIGYVVRDKCQDSYFEEKLAERLKQGFDALLSYNFYPSAAQCCQEAGIPYISWIYDGEDFGLYCPATGFDTSYIFCCDSAMAEWLKGRGAAHAAYMPLGVNEKRLAGIRPTAAERGRFRAEVCFIGSLYQNKRSADEYQLPPYYRGYFEGMLRAQLQICSDRFLDELLNEELAKLLLSNLTIDPRYETTERELALSLLLTSATKRERFVLLTALSERFPTTVYTFSDTKNISGLENRGVIDYNTDMPKAFLCSKINLNITHRMIKTGIPLRVMDVLGAGGFLISNYQRDMEGEFRDGENIVLYCSEEELLEKTAFYLEHDGERARIAANGREYVRSRHALSRHLFEMLGMACGSDAAETGKSPV